MHLKKQKIFFILAINIPGFQPAEGLLYHFMAVNRNRRCLFESTAQSRGLCVHKALRRTEFSAETYPEESSQLWDPLFTRCCVSANRLFTFSPNAYSICNDLSPPQPAAFINWDKPSDNWNLSRAVWGNRSQKCHFATEKNKNRTTEWTTTATMYTRNGFTHHKFVLLLFHEQGPISLSGRQQGPLVNAI